jgi:hypothetical protein
LELDDRGIGIPFPEGQRNVYIHIIRTESGAHPVSYSVDIQWIVVALLQGLKRPGPESLYLAMRLHGMAFSYLQEQIHFLTFKGLMDVSFAMDIQNRKGILA